MLKLRINPIVAKDLKNIRDYIAEDNEEYAAKTIKDVSWHGFRSCKKSQLSDRL